MFDKHLSSSVEEKKEKSVSASFPAIPSLIDKKNKQT
jgi:hypothetical protein